MKNKRTDAKTIESLVKPMERGQITLPIEIRKSMNITVDTWLLVRQTEEGILIKPVNISENKNSNIIPAKRPFQEVWKELKGKSFRWTDEDEKNRLRARELDNQRLSELLKKSMTGKILLDTSVLIDFARMRNKSDLIDAVVFKGLMPVISSTTLAELWAGQSMNNNKKFKYIMTLLEGVELINPTSEICKKAGELRRNSECTGGNIDSIIAATAVLNNITLLTYNSKQFKNVKGLKILVPEDANVDVQ